MIIIVIITKSHITSHTKYFNLVLCMFVTYIRLYSASFALPASTETILYQNSLVYCYCCWFWYRKTTCYVALWIFEIAIGFCIFATIILQLIYNDIWLVDVFKSVVYHPDTIFFHIWQYIVGVSFFSDISFHCVNRWFWCKIPLYLCFVWLVPFFFNSFFINSLSADIYPSTTTFPHWFKNWMFSFS